LGTLGAHAFSVAGLLLGMVALAVGDEISEQRIRQENRAPRREVSAARRAVSLRPRWSIRRARVNVAAALWSAVAIWSRQPGIGVIIHEQLRLAARMLGRRCAQLLLPMQRR